MCSKYRRTPISKCDFNKVDAWCKLAPLREQLQKYHYAGAYHWRKNIVAVITQDRVTDAIWKGKLKTELCIL